MKAQRTVLVIVGALATAVAIGFVFGGAGLLWADTGGEADGYVTVEGLELETDTYALTGMELELDIGPGDWIPPGRVASVKIDVEPVNGRPLFVGVGAHDEVTDYLAGVAQSEVDTFGRAVTYNHTSGSAPATRSLRTMTQEPLATAKSSTLSGSGSPRALSGSRGSSKKTSLPWGVRPRQRPL